MNTLILEEIEIGIANCLTIGERKEKKKKKGFFGAGVGVGGCEGRVVCILNILTGKEKVNYYILYFS